MAQVWVVLQVYPDHSAVNCGTVATVQEALELAESMFNPQHGYRYAEGADHVCIVSTEGETDKSQMDRLADEEESVLSPKIRKGLEDAHDRLNAWQDEQGRPVRDDNLDVITDNELLRATIRRLNEWADERESKKQTETDHSDFTE